MEPELKLDVGTTESFFLLFIEIKAIAWKILAYLCIDGNDPTRRVKTDYQNGGSGCSEVLV